MLEVEKLSISYGSFLAVDDISLSVGSGEIVALIGSNGAGKTTTLLGILGILKGDGAIGFDGRDISDWDPSRVVEHGIALVPEGRRVIGTLTVEENLEMGAYRRKGRSWKRDLEVLTARLPVLAERRTQLAGTLSGGEQQMLAIARGLMSRPKLLLLDEPSMGLAPMVIDEVYGLIREINEEGTSLLLVEQNAHLALETAQRAYVMEQGQIVHSGPASDLAHDPRIVEAYLT
jgi:branched-chain amino acid transport system ATP-binding protein